MNCNIETLIVTKNGAITQCRDCQRIGFTFKNLLIGFDPDQFVGFGRFLSRINFEKHCIRHSAKPPYLIINTCHHDIQFALFREEFEEFRDMAQQAKLMLEVLGILGPC
ncbi:hypothetical protein LVD17_03345 [Fulvivirga ulvae]|uniref:DUF6686 family protein n=1 Tax=Fulvivirga ulvae TaxID=2904245 RepID=UPI001F2DC8A5|nr:DUF6686 family protein [Fulvivirga ulvae]UII32866.1 hypothetical protein LVD17_03345 [Fulvivirga ulvae]